MDFFDEMIKRMKREMDKYFERFDRFPVVKGFREPLSNIEEKNDKITMNIEMPGVDKKDIQLKITENAVEVKADKKQRLEVRKKGFYKSERSYTGFYRRFALPENVKAEDAKAEYQNGILRIEIPKKKIAEKKVKVIEVK